jgi:DNA ligase D-like protein (predicted polymerase)
MRWIARPCKDPGVAKPEQEILELDGREVPITNPSKIYFPKAGITKLELVRYYLDVAEGALRGVARRPMILKRYVNGVEAEPFYQKRIAPKRPAWIETATFTFPSGRSAEEIVVTDRAQLAYVVNLGCVDLNPHAIRAEDMDRPDELRVDLDPVPGVLWPQILEVARIAREVLEEVGLVGWPKTSGSRGAHVWARIAPRWPFAEVRRAAIALAREVERRAPELATAKWWKEERRGVFVDYNQNARDRTTASAYSVRPLPDARVSMPLGWDDFLRCDPRDFTLRTVPAIFAARGDAHAGIDAAVGSLDRLLELAARQAAEGQPDAPLPPHFAKAEGEAPRVAPSRARGAAAARSAKSAGGDGGGDGAGGRRPKLPVITIAQAKQKADALAGLERWKARHPAVVAHLAPEDVIVDTNRGRATAWYRVRINLKNVPEAEHPPPEPLDPSYDPRTEYAAAIAAWKAARATEQGAAGDTADGGGGDAEQGAAEDPDGSEGDAEQVAGDSDD